MEFYSIQRIDGSAATPTVRTQNKNVLVSIPPHIAERAGLAEALKVDVKFGEDGGKRAILISAKADGPWSLTKRRRVRQLHLRELMPRREVAATSVEFEVSPHGLVLMLPTPWELADELVITRGASKVNRPARK